MALPSLQMVHAIPGRVRLRVPGGTPELESWRSRLAALDGVASVSANARTRSLLIHYDAARVNLPQELGLADTLGRRVDEEALVEEPNPGTLASNNRAPATTTARALSGAFWRADSEIYRMSSGAADLKLLIPAALLAAGAWELMAGEAIAGATFHTLAWYAYNIFYQLHPREMQYGEARSRQ